MPARVSAFSMPTCTAPRLPPPANTNAVFAALIGSCSNHTAAALTVKFARAHVDNLVGCRPAILFASAIRSDESEPR